MPSFTHFFNINIKPNTKFHNFNIKDFVNSFFCCIFANEKEIVTIKA